MITNQCKLEFRNQAKTKIRSRLKHESAIQVSQFRSKRQPQDAVQSDFSLHKQTKINAFIFFFFLVAVAVAVAVALPLFFFFFFFLKISLSLLCSTLMAAKLLPSSHLYPLPSNSFSAIDLSPRPCFARPRTHFKPHRSVTVRVSAEPLVALQDHNNSAFLLAESVGYSMASYYTSLGLFVISVPGLWSLIKRSVKSKVSL